MCSEDCDDSIDNDADGLVDCDDDECWGLRCHPEGVKVWVESGDWTIDTLTTFIDWDCHYSSSGTFNFARRTGLAENVVGKVAVLADGDTWATGTPTTCTWTVDEAEVKRTFDQTRITATHHTYHYARPGTREGFDVASGCRLADSSFLPEVHMRPSMPRGRARDLGRSWYLPQGPFIGSASGTTTYDSSCAFGTDTFTSSTRHVDGGLRETAPALLRP